MDADNQRPGWICAFLKENFVQQRTAACVKELPNPNPNFQTGLLQVRLKKFGVLFLLLSVLRYMVSFEKEFSFLSVKEENIKPSQIV